MQRRQAAPLLLLVCAQLVAACSSSDNAEVSDVPIDDDLVLADAIEGELDSSNDEFELRFTIDEDTVLDGQFSELATIDEAEPVLDPGEEPVFEFTNTGFTIVSLPENGRLTLAPDSTEFRYVPEADFFGTDSFVYATFDGDRIEVVIDIQGLPDAPTLDSNIPGTADQGRLYSVLLSATDVDGDELAFTAVNLPGWLSLDESSGLLSGVPRQSDANTVASGITLTVTDTTGLSDSIDNFEIRVVDINDAPTLNTTQVPNELFGRDTVSFNVFPDDLDADTVTVEVEANTAFEATVSGGTVQLDVADINEVMLAELTLIARDERGASQRIEIPVEIFPKTESGRGTTLSGVREGRGVHVVVLGDGYAADQQGSFRSHVEDVISNIRLDDGIADHLGALNIHMINTISNDSGSDDGEGLDTADTAFDSTYNCRAIARLVCADTLKLFEASLDEYPALDQIILLVNDSRFGGSGNSGGRVAITSAFFPEIALHEMGHSLADLADEYVDPFIVESPGLPPFEEGRFSNVSTLDDPELVPWAHWIDFSQPLSGATEGEGIGVFMGGHYQATGVYRPSFDSRMRSYSRPFGEVNTEQWILRLYTLTEGIRELSPQLNTLQAAEGEFTEFLVDPIFGTDVQELQWTLNGETLTATGNSASFASAGLVDDVSTVVSDLTAEAIELQGGDAIEAIADTTLTRLALSLPAGRHTLALTVSDSSGKIRISPPHAGIFNRTWEIVVL